MLPISAPIDAPPAQMLSAGPISCKFADGELRYLYVGDKEIVRRIYFAVRDGRWDTISPTFTKIDVQRSKDSFTVDLAADCRRAGSDVDFSWTGRIVGTPDGKITFSASGTPGADFKSNRIGLCVLYGAPSVAGQRFETIDAAGTITPYTFPTLVSHALVSPAYQTLRYTTAPGGMTVTTTVAGAARFDMEDQRTYGDTSFKAYAPLSYAYPNVPKGEAKEETVTLSVANPSPASPRPEGITVTLGGTVYGAKVPTIATTADPSIPNTTFGAVNGSADKNRGAKTLTWGLSSAVHLFDDDTYRENRFALLDQVKSARSYAPDAVITIAPIRVGASAERSEPEPRKSNAFGAAWAASVVKYLSLTGVAAAQFDLGPGASEPILKKLSAYAGKPIRETEIATGTLPTPIDAFAIDTDANRTTLVLINLAETPQTVAYPGGSVTLAAFEVREVPVSR